MNSSDVRRLLREKPHISVNGAGFPLGKERQGREIEEGAGKSPVRTKLERHAGTGRVGKKKAEGEDSRRFLVRITSVLHRLRDDDNICEKVVVDLCRYAGVLPDDNPRQTKIETIQRTPEEGEEPHTLIEVYQLE